MPRMATLEIDAMSPTATLSDTTVIDLSPPLSPPARRTAVLGSFKLTVEIVKTEDVGGSRKFYVDTRSGSGRLTSSTPFGDERAAMLFAVRLGI